MSSVELILREAASRLAFSTTPLLDARVLVKHALGLDDAGLILEAQRELTAAEAARLDALIARRAAGEPVAYIVGAKEFYGLTFKMAAGVLIPRPDSETLIDAAIACRPKLAALRIADLGTGTGCLLCALLHAFPKSSGVGIDVNPAAAALAVCNVQALGLGDRASVVAADWKSLGGQFDLIVSNPPYIADADRDRLDPDVRDYEDPRALFAGPSGLDAYKDLLAVLPRLAAPDSLVLLELGTGQAGAVRSIASNAFRKAHIGTKKDLAGRDRALVVDLSLEIRD